MSKRRAVWLCGVWQIVLYHLLIKRSHLAEDQDQAALRLPAT